MNVFPYEVPLDSAKRQEMYDQYNKDLGMRYYKAPDLVGIGNNAYRFMNAVSDFATHAAPLRRTANYKENLFARTVDGNPLIDRAYQLVCAA